MKYLTFLSAALSLTMLALLVVIGIQMDVLIAGSMKIYVSALVVAFSLFVLSLVMLIRTIKAAENDTDNKNKKKSGYAPSSFVSPSNH
jgi:hypothetical protein